MKILKNLTFTAMAVASLFQTTIARADDHDARASFRKWVTGAPNLPGQILDMGGVVGGDVGSGTFTGEVLHYVPPSETDPVERIVAFYHFHGSKRSFTALVRVEQTGLKAVIWGVVTDGWMKGHSVKGHYTQIECEHVGIDPFCYEGVLKIERN